MSFGANDCYTKTQFLTVNSKTMWPLCNGVKDVFILPVKWSHYIEMRAKILADIILNIIRDSHI